MRLIERYNAYSLNSQPTAYCTFALCTHATQPTVPSAKRSQSATGVGRRSARVGGSGAALWAKHPPHVWAAPDGPAASAERGGPAAHGEAALSRAAAPPRPPALSRHLRRAPPPAAAPPTRRNPRKAARAGARASPPAASSARRPPAARPRTRRGGGGGARTRALP